MGDSPFIEETMTKEEYQKLVELTLEMRILESLSSEIADRFKNANKILRELLLKENEDA